MTKETTPGAQPPAHAKILTFGMGEVVATDTGSVQAGFLRPGDHLLSGDQNGSRSVAWVAIASTIQVGLADRLPADRSSLPLGGRVSPKTGKLELLKRQSLGRRIPSRLH